MQATLVAEFEKRKKERKEKEGEKGEHRLCTPLVQPVCLQGARGGVRWPWSERMRPEEARSWAREGRGMETEFNVPLQWVTRGCNCRSGRNGAGIAADGRGSLITPRWYRYLGYRRRGRTPPRPPIHADIRPPSCRENWASIDTGSRPIRSSVAVFSIGSVGSLSSTRLGVILSPLRSGAGSCRLFSDRCEPRVRVWRGWLTRWRGSGGRKLVSKVIGEFWG